MKRIARRTADQGRDRWMVSYMDVLTILLIFFVAAAAQSKMAPKAVVVEKAAVKAPEPMPAAPPEPTQQKLETLGLDLKREPRGLVISLPQTILFASGDDAISAEARPLVEQIAAILREIPNRVTLVGHADAVPIHNRRFKNNWELAAARSLRLLELLGSDGGIADSRLSVASYSSFDPKDTNQTADGRASNRRVEIVILDEPAPVEARPQAASL
ncbi:MAG: flagellar motor protein MotB [Bryobacteraceae bacterium]